MKVIAIDEFGGPDKLHDEERAKPQPRPGDVLIRIHAGSFNPIDYKIRQGRFGGDVPMVLGHDAAGVVEEAGKDVHRLRQGDEVWAYLGGPCSNGSYAEYVSVPHEFATVKPRNLSFEEAASVPVVRSEEHTSELQSLTNLVCRLLLEKKKQKCQDQTQ